jgi:hypothetical protein
VNALTCHRTNPAPTAKRAPPPPPRTHTTQHLPTPPSWKTRLMTHQGQNRGCHPERVPLRSTIGFLSLGRRSVLSLARAPSQLKMSRLSSCEVSVAILFLGLSEKRTKTKQDELMPLSWPDKHVRGHVVFFFPSAIHDRHELVCWRSHRCTRCNRAIASVIGRAFLSRGSVWGGVWCMHRCTSAGRSTCMY